MRKTVVALVVGALALAACGGSAPEPVFPAAYPAPARDLELPEPVAAVPAFVIDVGRRGGRSLEARVERVPGVAAAASMRRGQAALETPGGGREVTVGAIDPLDFRPVAPPASRDASFVWSALLAGNAVLTFDAAEHLGARDAQSLELDGWGPVRIGAFADNGLPNLADVLVDRRVAKKAGIKGRRWVVVGVAPEASVEAVAVALDRMLPDDRIRPLLGLAGGASPEPAGQAQGGLVGTMRFKILPNGFIEPDPAWVAANITTAEVPIIGTVRCHRLLIPQMSAALAEVERAGLASLIDTTDYGGCYVPRFIGRDPSRALSMHAFGLAFDINVASNWMGTPGDMDSRLVEIFERWGFEWGGHWSTPDPMHFELDRLVRP